MKQHIFKFEERHDYLPENFLISSSNRAAYDAAENFTKNSYALNIHGPESSGKTYLAHIAALSAAGKKLHIIDELDAQTSEMEVFHLLNFAKENNEYVLITSQKPLAEMEIKLPDLRSRLNAIPSVGIEQPDDRLVYMLFARLFAAKQLKVSDDVISYLASRSPRNFAELNDIVHDIDRLSLVEKRNISISLIRKLLGNAGRD